MRASLHLVVACGLLLPGTAAISAQAPTTMTDSDPGALDLLARMFEGPTQPVAGTVAIIVLDADGPFVSELDVSATPAGEMVVGRRRSFAVGREDGDAFLARDGTLLRLGVALIEDDPVAALLENYVAVLLDDTDLDTGRADGIDLLDRAGTRRERLWLDRRSGVVVRRETYDLDGQPHRLVAFTELTLMAATVSGSAMPRSDVLADSGPVSELDPKALGTLAKTGWHVPDTLPGEFTLSRGFALDNGGDHSSLHLVYSDGLYQTSLYQQPGEVAPDAVRGGVWTEHDGLRVWRWPGAQPERMLWSSGGMTFTAVGDATTDHLLASLSQLPQGERDTTAARLGRGLRRVGSWLNPFS